jgi:hypothetical protein
VRRRNERGRRLSSSAVSLRGTPMRGEQQRALRSRQHNRRSWFRSGRFPRVGWRPQPIIMEAVVACSYTVAAPTHQHGAMSLGLFSRLLSLDARPPVLLGYMRLVTGSSLCNAAAGRSLTSF